MTIAIKCLSCGSKMTAPDKMAGRKVACPKCSVPITVPGHGPNPDEVSKKEHSSPKNTKEQAQLPVSSRPASVPTGPVKTLTEATNLTTPSNSRPLVLLVVAAGVILAVVVIAGILMANGVFSKSKNAASETTAPNSRENAADKNMVVATAPDGQVTVRYWNQFRAIMKEHLASNQKDSTRFYDMVREMEKLSGDRVDPELLNASAAFIASMRKTANNWKENEELKSRFDELAKEGQIDERIRKSKLDLQWNTDELKRQFDFLDKVTADLKKKYNVEFVWN